MPLRKAKAYLQLQLKLSKGKYEDLMASCALPISDHVFDTLLEQSYAFGDKVWDYNSTVFTFNELANSKSLKETLDEHISTLSRILTKVSPLYTQAVAIIDMTIASRKKSTEQVLECMEQYLLGQLSVLTVMETICVDLRTFWRHAWDRSSLAPPDHPYTTVESESYSENIQHLDDAIEHLQEVYDEFFSNLGEIMMNAYQRTPSTTAVFVPKDLRKTLVAGDSITELLAAHVDYHYQTGGDPDENKDKNDTDTILCSVTGKRWRREVMAVASLIPQPPMVPAWGTVVFNSRFCYYTFLSMRNFVRVHKDVKRALDMNRITLVPVPTKLGTGEPIECKIQVIDKSILDETILDDETDDSIYWLDVAELPKLQFPGINRPGLANMYHHTVMALIFAFRNSHKFKGYKDAMVRFIDGDIWPQDMKQEWFYTPVIEILTRRMRRQWPEFARIALDGARPDIYEEEFDGDPYWHARQWTYDMGERYKQTERRRRDEADGLVVEDDACNEGYT